MGGLLLRGACVLSLDRRVGNLTEADLLIDGGVVAEIGSGLRARDAEVIDARDRIVMPGFVDAHRSAWRSLQRGAGLADGSSQGVDAIHQPDDVYAATLLGLVSAAETGVTTVVDWSDIHVDDRYADAVFQAHVDAGLRTVLVPLPPQGAVAEVDETDLLRRATELSASTPTTTVAAGYAGPDLSDPQRPAATWSTARELGLRVHARAAGPADHGHVAHLGQQGLLGADTTLVHCTGLSDADLDAISSHGVRTVLTPANDMARGLGLPPVQALIDRDIRPGLGVDDERLAPGSIFAQMRSAQSLQHATTFDRKLAGKAGLPALLGTRDVIRYATVDGAAAAGLAGVTGTLAPGQPADVLVLRTDLPNIAPVNDPIGAVVWGMDASNVDWVIVGGRPLVRDGALQADLGHIRALATAAQQRLVGAASGPTAAEGEAR